MLSNTQKIIDDCRYYVADNIFLPEVIDELREFALTTDIRNEQYEEGYFSINYDSTYVPLPLIRDVVLGLQNKFPFLGEFDRGWAFVYNNEAPGVTPHADPSRYNVNLWVTPNECVVDEEKNGLIIYDIKPPLSWTYEEYNSSAELIRKYLDYTKSKKTIIPYSCNRLLIFNSKYFHETNNVSMKDGPMNRRVNYTFMFKGD